MAKARTDGKIIAHSLQGRGLGLQSNKIRTSILAPDKQKREDSINLFNCQSCKVCTLLISRRFKNGNRKDVMDRGSNEGFSVIWRCCNYFCNYVATHRKSTQHYAIQRKS